MVTALWGCGQCYWRQGRRFGGLRYHFVHQPYSRDPTPSPPMKTDLCRTGSNGVQVSQCQGSFATVPTLPSDADIASDKKTDAIFSGTSGSALYISKNNGKIFAKMTRSLGSSTSPYQVIVHPNVTGDVWVSTDKGLFHSTDSGASLIAIKSVTRAWSIALGAPMTTGGFPALYPNAIVGGVLGLLRSDDAGVN